ncbi:hypothetical protein Pelo_2787 [Pelomyxa schiedti]|nr:hypothetical protein Pelo_2787 [Pelomyxa schiedti]
MSGNEEANTTGAPPSAADAARRERRRKALLGGEKSRMSYLCGRSDANALREATQAAIQQQQQQQQAQQSHQQQGSAGAADGSDAASVVAQSWGKLLNRATENRGMGLWSTVQRWMFVVCTVVAFWWKPVLRSATLSTITCGWLLVELVVAFFFMAVRSYFGFSLFCLPELPEKASTLKKMLLIARSHIKFYIVDLLFFGACAALCSWIESL